MLKFALVGESLSHSRSPQIHEKIMQDQGIQGTYDLLEFSRDDFAEKFTSLKNSDYRGVNVTIPYKETVIPFLDEISPQARYIGAVNTVLFENGKAKGYNTDYHGFLSLFQQNSLEIKNKEAVILGSGGAAKCAVKVLLDHGIIDITIVSRSKQNFHGIYTVSYDFFKESIQPVDLLINCTPIGMYPKVDQSPLSKPQICAKAVIDLIYNPEETLLLRQARELGCKTVNGSLMLVEQAIKAQEIWNEQ